MTAKRRCPPAGNWGAASRESAQPATRPTGGVLMDTTIDRPTDIRRPRKTRHRREDVVAAVEELHGMGLKRDEIAREFGMATGCRGALYVALSRAGRRDLWKAIKPADGSLPGFSVERTL